MGRSIDPMKCWARRDAAVGLHPAPIVSMSLRPSIPGRVALQHGPLALPRLLLESNQTVVRASLLQRTASCPFFPGLIERAHSMSVTNLSRTRPLLAPIGAT